MSEPTKKNDPPGVATRRAALKVLDAVLRRGLPLENALASATSGLERADDRGLAHAIAAAVLRRLPDLDALIDSATQKPLPWDAKARFLLRIALAQALFLETPGHAAISTVLPLADGGPRKLVHGVFGALMRKGATLPELPTLPAAVAQRWRAAWGDETVEAARQALLAPPPLDITLAEATDKAGWAERLGGLSLAPGHVRLPAGAKVAELPGYAEGAWWVQDIAASLPARLLGDGDGKRALDLCAAPGGKTMQLAAAGWRVTAVDASDSRMGRLRENLERTGLAAKTVVADALFYSPDTLFDAVLVDAPCSATGIYRRHPDVLHRVRPKAIASLAEQQQAILARAAQAVKPGGMLVYAVCSLEPEEGESVAEQFLASHSGFTAASSLPGARDYGFVQSKQDHIFRVRPGELTLEGGADGFFVAMFHRKDEPPATPG
jgi:16S rRNA (cytosine967-C5)-methyltransferase